jgi:hypothetical protein
MGPNELGPKELGPKELGPKFSCRNLSSVKTT